MHNGPDNYLFIDTETTGLPKRGVLVTDGQARVCQLAMLLTDNRGRSLAEFGGLVKPDGWEIGEEASKIHGLTTEFCEVNGFSAVSLVSLYQRFAKMAGVLVSHNTDFDRGMMEIEQAYVQRQQDEVFTVNREWFCTMNNNLHINNGKKPKLSFALQHYCQRDLGDKAHDAMHDVKACRDIFFAMRGIKVA